MARKGLEEICRGIQIDPLPEYTGRNENLIHAPFRQHGLNSDEKKKAVDNALRYFPFTVHNVLRPEFERELELYGHIYMYRFMPKMDIKAYPFKEYPGNLVEAKAIMLMIMNNLDPQVAQFPQELVTYGSNGQVFSNWAQFLLTMKYLSQMNDDQTLVLSSGHPMGLYPTNPSCCCDANSGIDELIEPELYVRNKVTTRLIISNGMMVPEYSTKIQHDRLFSLGVTMYGQMTAGSFCYIGPQGIVHGTVITLLNVARKYMGGDMAGKVFLSSGLGGMSGAQAKAATIVGCIGVIAEVSEEAILKRHEQGWVKEILTEAADCVARVKEAKLKKETNSIAFHGNVVDLWQAFVQDYVATGGEKIVDFGSDQTSLHNPFNGGYYPQGLTIDQANLMMRDRPKEFEEAVKASLRLQIQLINELNSRTGLIFWDYGNAFLLEACRAKADVTLPGSPVGIGLNPCFRYPSYVQEIMGDVFALGFGPFRWVCTSGSIADLELTDKLALDVLEKRLFDLKGRTQLEPKEVALTKIIQLYQDNVIWMRHIIDSSGRTSKLDNEGYLTVGSKARILYSDAAGRMELAKVMNKAIAEGRIKWPIVLTRDHHDVSGADSPFRETSDIKDGSSLCADMSVLNILGNVARGATWVAIHNGGGVGWGQAINNGLGLVLDGTPQTLNRALAVLAWDVQNGVSRRCWSNIQPSNNSAYVIQTLMESDPLLKVTIPYQNN